MAASVTGRSRLVLALCRVSRSSSSSSSFSAARSFSIPSRSSSFVRHRSLISPPLLRSGPRELSSLQPLHSTIASACLVSKLPNEVSTSTEGRFANYLSPI